MSITQQQKKGFLLAIEGIDGSGKSTQFQLLLDRLKKAQVEVMTMKFPQYEEKSSGPVTEYLNRRYSDLNPYTAALLYAVDHFDGSLRKINPSLQGGKLVVLDRFIDSNFAHQGSKLLKEKEREDFLMWLSEIEYRKMGVPAPDKVIILRMPPGKAQQFVAEKQKRSYLRQGTHDIHEGDLRHLERTQEVYLWLSKREPDRYVVIECVENGAVLSPEAIHEKVWAALEPILILE